jgi:hypothetical protein
MAHKPVVDVYVVAVEVVVDVAALASPRPAGVKQTYVRSR